MSIAQTPAAVVEYPDCDGEPMSDNTLQADWISLLKWGIETAFRPDPNVFVAMDLLVYPAQGDNKTRAAPDVLVAFGRPKGYRGSYRVWEEGGVFPQVVIEVLSPGNRAGAMNEKLRFYERFGAVEYLIVDPDPDDGKPTTLRAYLRRGERLAEARVGGDYTSALLGFRFVQEGNALAVYDRAGTRVEKPDETGARRAEAEAARAVAEARRDEAVRQAEVAAAREASANAATDRLAAKLRELGFDPGPISSGPDTPNGGGGR